MSKRHFIIRYRSGDEQSITAEKVLEEDEYLVFLNPSNPNDELAALFYLPEVKEWHEVSEA
jgi:hypothetical protein